MRRAWVLVCVVGLAAMSWAWVQRSDHSSDQGWAVAFTMSVGLDGNDPCTSNALITGGLATGPSNYGGFWTVANRDDAQTVAECYEGRGGQADVHKTTPSERDRLAEEERLRKLDD